MVARFCVLVFFFALFGASKSNPFDCISRDEFEKFKTDVFTRIEKLSMEKNDQTKQIEDQMKVILDLKTLLANYGDTSSISSHSNSTKNVPLEVSDDDMMDFSSVPLPLKTDTSSKRLLSTPTRAPEDVIAFYAYLSTSEINPGAHHVIIYDHVITNAGNGYNKHTGAFIAPRMGFYVLSWTAFACGQSYFPVELTVNSAPVGVVYSESGTTYNGVTGVAVVQLQQNDVVMFRTKPGLTPHGSICSSENMRTAFSVKVGSSMDTSLVSSKYEDGGDGKYILLFVNHIEFFGAYTE